MSMHMTMHASTCPHVYASKCAFMSMSMHVPIHVPTHMSMSKFVCQGGVSISIDPPMIGDDDDSEDDSDDDDERPLVRGHPTCMLVRAHAHAHAHARTHARTRTHAVAR